MDEQIILIFMAVVVAIFIYLILLFIFRAVNLWYFKINKRVQLEEEILSTLKRIEEKMNTDK